MTNCSRRDFLKTGAGAGLTLAMGQSTPVPKTNTPDLFFPVLAEEASENLVTLSAGQ